jgi:hypothetical protein
MTTRVVVERVERDRAAVLQMWIGTGGAGWRRSRASVVNDEILTWSEPARDGGKLVYALTAGDDMKNASMKWEWTRFGGARSTILRRVAE